MSNQNLSTKADQLHSYMYDELGHTSTVQFSGDGGVTPNKSFAYDADGHETSATGAVYGVQTTHYDADGRVSEVDEPLTGSMTSPAKITYDYYPNGKRKDVNVSSSALNANPLLSYAYRSDGVRTRLHSTYGSVPGDFAWTYTDAGRTTSQSDPYTGSMMPSPQAPVGAGAVYPAKAWSYDANGQVSSISLPQTLAYQSMVHDDEGEVLSWVGSNSVNGPAIMTYGVTLRGEIAHQSLGSTGTAAMYNVQIANGAVAKRPDPVVKGGPPTTPYSATVDPINAVIASQSQDQYVPNSNPEAPQWEDCGSMTTTNGYDAASRLVSTITTMKVNTSLPDCANYDAGPDTTPLYAYDAENHHISVSLGGGNVSNGAQWSPNGKAYNVQGSTLHYDGNLILFITDSNGALKQGKVETLGDFRPSTGVVTVLDRGVSDEYVSQHNGSFYGGISLGTTMYKPPGSTSTAQSVPYIFYGSTNDTLCSKPGPSGASCSSLGNLEYVRPEGFTFNGLTYQGARAVDDASGRWTTPDAYAGDVHDPMSQKAFMWDRNNPYSYTDTSGYSPNAVAISNDGWGAGRITSAGQDQQVADAGVGPGQLNLDLLSAIDDALKQLRNSGEHAGDISDIIVSDLMNKNNTMNDRYNVDDPQRLQRYSVVQTKSSQGINLTVSDSVGTAHATLSIRDNSVVLRIFGARAEIDNWRKDIWFDHSVGWPMYRASWSRGVKLPLGFDNSPGKGPGSPG
jgi:hypothetical protein